VLEALRTAAPKPLSLDEIRDRAKLVSEVSTRKLMSKMVRDGEVAKPERGLYAAVKI
jgi:hypothetical protein